MRKYVLPILLSASVSLAGQSSTTVTEGTDTEIATETRCESPPCAPDPTPVPGVRQHDERVRSTYGTSLPLSAGGFIGGFFPALPLCNSGTSPVPLFASTQPCYSVILTALPNNTGWVWIGYGGSAAIISGSGDLCIHADFGLPLFPGSRVQLRPPPNPSTGEGDCSLIYAFRSPTCTTGTSCQLFIQTQ